YTRDTTSGQEGLDLLARVGEIDPTLPVVVMTAWGSVGLAVEAMQRGARDFVQKPWDNARLLSILSTQVELARALRKGERLEAENKMLRADGDGARPLLIAASAAMQPVLELTRPVGPSHANVPVNLQTKLLRVLETGEFERVGSSQTRRADVRLLSATNADLKEEVAAGRFRQDLFFRLNTVEIHLPPLRERPEDIAALAEHFLRLYAQRYRKGLAVFEPATLEAMRSYAWPGNVRELDHVVQRAVLMSRGDEVKAVDLGLQPVREMGERRLEEMSLEDVERLLIQKALKRFGGNVSQAAEALGLSRSALYRRMQKYEI